MSGFWTDIKNAYFSYNGMGVNLFFWFIAVIYLLVINREKYKNLLLYEIFGMLLFVTPGIANYLFKTGGGTEKGWMLYGILNVTAFAAYAATDYFFSVKGKGEKIFVVVMYLVLLQAGMSINYTADHFTVAKNMYKIAPETFEIASGIEFLEEPRILAPDEVGRGLREYDTRYAVIYGEGLSFTQENINQLQVEIASYGCNCVILNTEYENQEVLNNIGFSKVCSTENYVVYAK